MTLMRGDFDTKFHMSIGNARHKNHNHYNHLFNMPFDIEKCARPNILALEPYRCARECVPTHNIILLGIEKARSLTSIE